jgi:hypothetical protein
MVCPVGLTEEELNQRERINIDIADTSQVPVLEIIILSNKLPLQIISNLKRVLIRRKACGEWKRMQ